MQSLVYFLLFGALIFFMMRFGCGAHVAGHGHSHGGPSGDDPAQGHGGGTPSSAVDPVCGMSVKPDSAKSSVFGGRAYYFCSAACRDKFEATPNQYAGAAPGHSRGHAHGC